MIAALSGSATVAVSMVGGSNLSAAINVTGDTLSTSNVGLAVWRTMLEDGFTADRILRIVAAAVAGLSSGTNFRNLTDTQDQIIGTSSGGDRIAAAYGD